MAVAGGGSSNTNLDGTVFTLLKNGSGYGRPSAASTRGAGQP